MKKITRMDVEALKKEMPVLDEMTQRSVCGGSGDYDYTYSQYMSMLDSGSWKGGTVQGMGFVASEVVSTPGEYYGSLGDFISSLKTTPREAFLKNLIPPGFSGFYEFTEMRLQNEFLSAASACTNLGYTGPVRVQVETSEYMGLSVKLYNANTGDLITTVTNSL